MINLKNKAFTLAEVLITLTIIGVIATMTIPALMQDVEDQVFKTQYKKTYAVLDNAIRMVENNNGGTLAGLCTADGSDNCLKNELIKYLNVSTSCDAIDGRNNCTYDIIQKLLNGSYMESSLLGGAGVVLANGTMLSIGWSTTYGGTIIIDTNGREEPNQYAKDVYYIDVTNNGIKPYRAGYEDGCDLDANSSTTGLDCAAEYLKQ